MQLDDIQQINIQDLDQKTETIRKMYKPLREKFYKQLIDENDEIAKETGIDFVLNEINEKLNSFIQSKCSSLTHSEMMNLFVSCYDVINNRSIHTNDKSGGFPFDSLLFENLTQILTIIYNKLEKNKKFSLAEAVINEKDSLTTQKFDSFELHDILMDEFKKFKTLITNLNLLNQSFFIQPCLSDIHVSVRSEDSQKDSPVIKMLSRRVSNPLMNESTQSISMIDNFNPFHNAYSKMEDFPKKIIAYVENKMLDLKGIFNMSEEEHITKLETKLTESTQLISDLMESIMRAGRRMKDINTEYSESNKQDNAIFARCLSYSRKVLDRVSLLEEYCMNVDYHEFKPYKLEYLFEKFQSEDNEILDVFRYKNKYNDRYPNHTYEGTYTGELRFNLITKRLEPSGIGQIKSTSYIIESETFIRGMMHGQYEQFAIIDGVKGDRIGHGRFLFDKRDGYSCSACNTDMPVFFNHVDGWISGFKFDIEREKVLLSQRVKGEKEGIEIELNRKYVPQKVQVYNKGRMIREIFFNL